MSRRGRWGLALLLLGLILLIGALTLWQSNRHEALEAEEASREVMGQLAERITLRQTEDAAPDQGEEEPAFSPEPEDDTEDPAPDGGEEPEAPPSPEPAEKEILPMDTVEIDGRLYVGFLTIPDLQLELPVMAEWDYDRLNTAPCRYSGTIAGGDLVIAAHNYPYHFGRLKDLSLGAEILFTDVNGVSTRFSVAELEILPPTAVEDMIAGDYELTLFTCTYGGATRFTVRCLCG